MAKLHVEITADGARRIFSAEGHGPVIVAAFRHWLAGPDCVLPMAEGADAVDVEAAEREAPDLPPAIIKGGVPTTRLVRE